ncbi:hypothetical protein HYR69_01545, partial [Candidatus Sumerlaeota bacterium]|nr:hypothetical protein [Candidatus Sumerlaeota bacterium]
MPVTKSADLLLAELSATVKGELLATIGPIARRIAEAAAELESALSGGGRRGRRGRRRGPGRPAAAKPGRKRGRSADGKLPRGA